MLKIYENYMVDRSTVKCDLVSYTPQTLLSSNIANYQLSIDITKEESVKSLKDSSFETEFDLIRNDNNGRFDAADNTKVCKFGPTAFFSDHKLSCSSWKNLPKLLSFLF